MFIYLKCYTRHLYLPLGLPMNILGLQLSVTLSDPRALLHLVLCSLKAHQEPLRLLHDCQGSQSNVIHSIPMLWFCQATCVPVQPGRMASPLVRRHSGAGVAYLTKKTVSLQNDSSQLGPGTTSAHSGSRWWGRVTLRVKRNSRSAAVTRVSSRMTQEDVKSGVNLTTRGIVMNFWWFSL